MSKVKVSYKSSSEDDDENDAFSGGESGDECSNDSQSDTSQDDNDGDDKAEEMFELTKKHGADAVVDVMAKILGKSLPENKSSILCKGTTDRQLERRRRERGIDEGDDLKIVPVKTEKVSSDDSEDDGNTKNLTIAQKQKRRIWENMGRVKPNILDKDKEKQLQRIATKGVVQLFNAVKKQQKIVNDKLREVGSSVRKKDKVLQTMTKGKFMDVLKGTVSNVSAEPVTKKIKTESDLTNDVKVKEEKEDPSWSILREDFMMGAKMKDWDKESDGSDGIRNDDISDSDADT